MPFSERQFAPIEESSAEVEQPSAPDFSRMRRFVVAVADGDSDEALLARSANKRLKEAGVPVDLLLIVSEEDKNSQQAAEGVYQSVIPVPDVNDLAEKGLTRLTERIGEAYAQDL